MSWRRYLMAGLMVAMISTLYSYAVFSVFGINPEVSFELEFADEDRFFFLMIFVKNFLVGVILTFLFSVAYRNLTNDSIRRRDEFKGIFFAILYALFALVVFSLGDILLMKTPEGMLILITLDGFVESLIATVPIRFFVDPRTNANFFYRL